MRDWFEGYWYFIGRSRHWYHRGKFGCGIKAHRVEHIAHAPTIKNSLARCPKCERAFERAAILEQRERVKRDTPRSDG